MSTGTGGRSILQAFRLLRRRSPDLLIFQWWTAAVLHSYIAMAMAAKLTGTRIIIEFHETQDVGESERLLARWYLKLFFPLLSAMASGCIVHSDHDRDVIIRKGWFSPAETAVAPHGPYDHLTQPVDETAEPEVVAEPRDATVTVDEADPDTRLLYFGVLRPYKGVEVLAAALELLPDDAAGFRLTAAGEPWEGYTGPFDELRAGRAAGRVTVIDRYVTDDELSQLLAATDVVVLPYLRGSASGPLHVAMSWGLPVVVSDVEGLSAAASRYEGAILVPPGDGVALAAALLAVRQKVGRVYTDPFSWSETVKVVEDSYEGCWSPP